MAGQPRVAPQARSIGASPGRGPARYAAFVARGKGVKLWDEALQGQIYLGGNAFVQRMQARIDGFTHEIPRAQLRNAKPLTHYFKHSDRDVAIVLAYREGGYTQTAIAAGLSVSRVSRLIAASEAKGDT